MTSTSLNESFEKRNAETSDHWREFAPHRERLVALLEEHRPAGARSLCVLGAGNCNDLDLRRLLASFDCITLVDLDSVAMQRGISSQLHEPALRSRVVAASLDVTGVFHDLAQWGAAGVAFDPPRLHRLMERLNRTPAPVALGRQFDCVISTCLLSQLIDAVRSVVGENPTTLVPLVQSLRRQHIRTLGELTSPAGLTALIFDYVSSETVPSLASCAESQIVALSKQLIAAGNFFTGLRPSLVEYDFESLLGRRKGGSTMALPPWRWNLGPRLYLVMGLLARFDK
jgi:hypothetical protein